MGRKGKTSWTRNVIILNTIILSILNLFVGEKSFGVMIPTGYFDTVVAIEMGTKIIDKNTSNMTWKIETIATGFLVGFKTSTVSADGKPEYQLFLISNKHVFKDIVEELYFLRVSKENPKKVLYELKSDKKQVFFRFNKKEKGSQNFPLSLVDENGELIWLGNPNADVGIIPVDPEFLKQNGVFFNWFRDDDMAFRENKEGLGISVGDEVSILGFPMGISGEEKNYVVARFGIIARWDDEIVNKTGSFLIDAKIFPGNSGSPVVIRPTDFGIGRSKTPIASYLIGMVAGYLPYQDIAISPQTKETRIMFEENSGLAQIIPMDSIRDTVYLYWNQEKKEVQQ